jgi:cation transporter-like permease
VRRTGIRRNLLILSLVNWVIAIVAWTISAYLGISQPTGIFTYTVLFVIGLFAVVVAVLTFALEKFSLDPVPVTASPQPGADGAEPPAGGAEPPAAGGEEPRS